MTMNATAHVATAMPARYIGRLCRHFAHKLPVSFDELQGRIQFPFGLALLAADPEGLRLRVEAVDAEQLAKLQQVVASHFERFAWQHALSLDWQ
ncbi:DUF2218 domain-containing protein [Pseudomonas zhanjiangensis]|uniref:DUF2218 domain-containing protein n=1 Tax=Pseudomonas zhanjiangensis TaxID=3239015 RepID=A0ABV3YUG2_9PSED